MNARPTIIFYGRWLTLCFSLLAALVTTLWSHPASLQALAPTATPTAAPTRVVGGFEAAGPVAGSAAETAYLTDSFYNAYNGICADVPMLAPQTSPTWTYKPIDRVILLDDPHNRAPAEILTQQCSGPVDPSTEYSVQTPSGQTLPMQRQDVLGTTLWVYDLASDSPPGEYMLTISTGSEILTRTIQVTQYFGSRVRLYDADTTPITTTLSAGHRLQVDYSGFDANSMAVILLYHYSLHKLELVDHWQIQLNQNGAYHETLQLSGRLQSGNYYLGACETSNCTPSFDASTFKTRMVGMNFNLASSADASGNPNSNPSNSDIVDFSGRWYTNFAEVTLEQNGETVTGSYVQYGRNQRIMLEGTVSKRTLSGYYNGDRSTHFLFTLREDGNSLDGNWLYQRDGQPRQWCGVRADTGPLPPGCGFSGEWRTCCDASNQEWITTLTQERDMVTGEYFYNVGDTARGYVQGQLGKAHGDGAHYKLLGQYTDEAGDTGAFRWDLLDFNAQQFQGCWRAGNARSQPWCGWREGENQPSQCMPKPSCP